MTKTFSVVKGFTRLIQPWPNRLNRWQWLSAGLLLGGLLIAGIMTILPNGTTWGVYHAPHIDGPSLRLSKTVVYEQTFIPEFSTISGLLLLVQPPIPPDGRLIVDLQQGDARQSSVIQLTDMLATGESFAQIAPLRVTKRELVVMRVSIENTPTAAGLLYEIDATKYPDGELSRVSPIDGSRKSKAGDLAFRVRYQSSALERMRVPLVLALAVAVMVVGGWYGLLHLPHQSVKSPLWWRRADTWIVVVFSILIGGFFLLHFGLARLSHPTAQGDEMKNLLYLHSTVEALRSGLLPYWHHLTCGGQPLMGNPEANTVGLGPLLGLLFGVATGSKVLVVFEAVLLAVGLYVFARYLGLRPIPSLLPTLLVPLSGYVVNRILIGHTMYTGGLAFAPWILLTYVLSLQSRHWIIVTGALMAFALYRGDTHALFYTLILIVVWGIVVAVQRRTIRPLALGLLAGVFFLLIGAGKIMPILESTSHFNGDALPPMVVLLTRHQMWDDIFLDRSIHTNYLDAELTGGKWEDWENIGLYTGLTPFLLSALGLLFMPRRLKWILGPSLLLFFLLGEGTLYHLYLREIPYVGSLLRLPSRTLIMVIIIVGLTGAFALQVLDRWRIGRWLAAVVLAWTIFVAGSYAHQTLARMEFAAPESVPVDAIPLILQPHPYQEGLHPLSIAQRNSVAPGSCQDFNVAPTFTITPGTPFITTVEGKPVSATLKPNVIQIAPPASRSVIVRIAESAIMDVENGYTLPATSAGLPMVIYDSTKPVTLSYHSFALPAGLILSFASATSLWCLWKARPGSTSRSAAGESPSPSA